ncbi:MAG: hypothetical protein V2A54_07375 [Bacteroidota bacterium]
MKKIFISLMLVAAFSVTNAQTKSTNSASVSWIKSTTVLTYKVVANGSQYDYVVDSLTLGNSIAFRWKMGAPKNMKGKVRMSQQALDTASAMNNYFRNNEFLDLKDKTSVWMGRKIRKAIAENKPITVDPQNTREVLTPKGEKSYTFTINGTSTTIKVLYAETASGKKFWFLNDAVNPLILKMDLGWTIELISVTK